MTDLQRVRHAAIFMLAAVLLNPMQAQLSMENMGCIRSRYEGPVSDNSFYPIHPWNDVEPPPPMPMQRTVNDCGCIQHALWMYDALLTRHREGEATAEVVWGSLDFHPRCPSLCERQEELQTLLDVIRREVPRPE